MHRRYKPDLIYEVCIRTIDGAWRFEAHDPAMRQAIVGAMARAQQRTGVRVHAFTFLSNHYHGIYSSDFPDQLANFLCHFHAAVARLANRHWCRSGRLWNGRASVVPILADPSVQLRRLDYVLGQAVRAGAAVHPRDWAGASSTPWLLDGTPLEGKYVDQTAVTLAARNGRDPGDVSLYTVAPTLKMTPMPCFAGMGEDEWRARVRAMADEIAAARREKPAHLASAEPAGALASFAPEPDSRTARPQLLETPRTSPQTSPPPSRRRAKRVHAASRQAERDFVEELDAFEEQYDEARRQLREQAALAVAGKPTAHVRFPDWSFPGPAPGWPRAGRQLFSGKARHFAQ